MMRISPAEARRRRAALERETDEAVERALQIQGLYRRQEARFLYQLARRKGNIVEIGCWMGRTTAILVQAARVWGASVTSIDPFVVLSAKTPAASPEQWRANLERAGLEPPTLLAMTSDEAAKFYDQEIAFLFIDGDHSRAQVLRDLANWTPKIKVGGVVALHDMFYPSITGVCQAVATWWSKERDENGPYWECVGMHDLTIAFRRLR